MDHCKRKLKLVKYFNGFKKVIPFVLFCFFIFKEYEGFSELNNKNYGF